MGGLCCSTFIFHLNSCQDVFLDNVHLEDNIAPNMALKENIFMMIVCIENRIPLFLVGKPGSSKSLSKAMIMEAMKGTASKSDFFKRMKQVSVHCCQQKYLFTFWTPSFQVV